MCDSQQIQKLEDKFKTSLEIRNFEIDLFWKRSLFFWGFIASAFVAFAKLHQDHSEYTILLANFGMVCSFAWTLANRGSKYWQENWEKKLFNSEKHIMEGFFSKPDNREDKSFPYYNKRFSVSKLAIVLSDFTFGIWLVIVVAETLSSWMCLKTLDTLLSICSIVSFIYIVYIACNCRGKDKS